MSQATTNAAAPPVGARASGNRRARLLLGQMAPPVLVVAGLLLVWELLTRTNVLPSEYLPPVGVIAETTVNMAADGAFWLAIAHTVRDWALGLVIAICIGIPLGIAMGTNKWFERALRPTVEFLRPVPPVALIPVVILIYGTSGQGAVFLAAFASAWPLLIQSMYGVRAVDSVARDTARVLQLGRFRRVTTLVLPSAAPSILVGVRISASISLILVISSGIIIGTSGLGSEIAFAARAGIYADIYSLIFITGLLGLLVNRGFAVLERRLVNWSPDARRGRDR